MVTPAPAIGCCGVAEFDALVPLLDQEFIFGKSRRMSLAQRFPGVLDRDRPENTLVARIDGDIASALAIKRFTWITAERGWSAAMIGMVYTRPERRGRGTAGALMRAAQEQLAREGSDFAVLWTSRPEFYLRLGWQRTDCGILGDLQSGPRGASASPASPSAADIAWMEQLRTRYAPDRAARTEESYASLYPPAERLDLLRSKSAYALLGADANGAYLYEMLGDGAEFPALWSGISARYGRLLLNLARDTPAQRFLQSQTGISWQAQRLAMWLPLGTAARGARFDRWYIPFLDRI